MGLGRLRNFGFAAQELPIYMHPKVMRPTTEMPECPKNANILTESAAQEVQSLRAREDPAPLEIGNFGSFTRHLHTTPVSPLRPNPPQTRKQANIYLRSSRALQWLPPPSATLKNSRSRYVSFLPPLAPHTCNSPAAGTARAHAHAHALPSCNFNPRPPPSRPPKPNAAP